MKVADALELAIAEGVLPPIARSGRQDAGAGTDLPTAPAGDPVRDARIVAEHDALLAMLASKCGCKRCTGRLLVRQRRVRDDV